MLQTLKHHFKLWLWHGASAMQVTFTHRGTNALFFLGKIVRLGMSLIILFVIKNNISSFGQYTTEQMLVFFLVYLWIDTLTQAVYRGVYMFGSHVRQGNFDFDLMKPVNPLFKSLMGEPDINDVIFLIPAAIASIWTINSLDIQFSFINVALFFLLFINSFVIATALHIMILSFAILTTDIDGIMWLYRDFNRFGQFPASIYKELMRFALFFIIPIGMMITIPAEVLLELRPTYAVWLTIVISGVFLAISMFIWKKSLEQYTSASS